MCFALRILRDRGAILGVEADFLAATLEEILEVLGWPEEPMPSYEEAQRQWYEQLYGASEEDADPEPVAAPQSH